jgi:hypothetical protein
LSLDAQWKRFGRKTEAIGIAVPGPRAPIRAQNRSGPGNPNQWAWAYGTHRPNSPGGFFHLHEQRLVYRLNRNALD